MHTGIPRFEVLCAPAHWRRVDFISDLHLQAGAPHASVSTLALWQHYLQTTPTDALIILGDLFEVWVGDDALRETGSFEALVCADLQAAARRLPVWFMQGNRDFQAGAAFIGHCGIAALADPAVLVFGGQRILLSHGDLLCLEDRDYQRFRLQVRSAAWQQRFLAQPLAVRRAQARGMRQESEARKHMGAPCADVDAAAAIAWLNVAGARTLVHGHTHRPAEHALAPGLQRLVLSDWDAAATPARAEVLRLSAAGWQRLAALP